MKAPTVAARAVAHSLSISPYPPSTGGGLGTYAFSLGSLLTICSLVLMLGIWVAEDLIRERRRRPLCGLATLYRLMLLGACIGTTMATLPHAAYMWAYNDPHATVGTLARLLRAERMADAIRVVPAVLWVGIAFLTYPYVIIALTGAPASSVFLDRAYMLANWRRLMRPLAVAIVASALAYTVGVTKGHEPVPISNRIIAAAPR